MTKFRDITDRAYSSLLTSYELDGLLKDDEFVFYGWMENFVVNAIDQFDGCVHSLSFHEVEIVDDKGETHIEHEFDEDLDSKEMYILALFIAIGYYKAKVDDITQYRLHLDSRTYKTFSEASNLSRRLERLNALHEEVSQKINDYQLAMINRNGLSYFMGGN